MFYKKIILYTKYGKKISVDTAHERLSTKDMSNTQGDLMQMRKYNNQDVKGDKILLTKA